MGIDVKIREFIENLDLDPLPRTQSSAVHPDISTRDKSTVNRCGTSAPRTSANEPDTEGKPTGDQIQGSAFYKPEHAADMESQLPPELIDVSAQNTGQLDMQPMTHEETLMAQRSKSLDSAYQVKEFLAESQREE